jgi:hypothetical protein
MTRKSKREIERWITDLHDRGRTASPVVGFEVEDAPPVDADGESLAGAEGSVVIIPKRVWGRWRVLPAFADQEEDGS